MFVLIKIEYTKAVYETFNTKPQEDDESLSHAESYIAYNRWRRNVFNKTIRSEAIKWLDTNMRQYEIKSIDTDDDENIDIYLK